MRRGSVAAALGLSGGACLLFVASSWPGQPEPPRQAVYAPHAGEPVVWVTGDGHRVESRRGRMPAMTGQDNPTWSPGGPATLFGLPGEVVALQVVVTAGGGGVAAATVRLTPLTGPAVIGTEQMDRFVVHELPMARRSGGAVPGESLGWSAGAAPPGPAPGGTVADPLIPVDAAPSWADYPMTVPAGAHRVVWVDIALPLASPPGLYRGDIVVAAGAGGQHDLARIPIELDVGSKPLPYRALRTMQYFDPEQVKERVGSERAVEEVFKVLHAHHLSVVFPIRSAADVRRHRDALRGALYTPERGYHGPGLGVPMDVAIVGVYGSLGEAAAEKLAGVGEIVRSLAELGIHDEPGVTDVFLYAVDEECESPRGPEWRRTLAAAPDPAVRALRVGQTCSEPPAAQPVDLVMMHAPLYDPTAAREAREHGKRVWIYNGALPRTGAFLTDSWAVSLRANAWIQAHYGIERWFYWESTFWSDGNRGGEGPYDPWSTAETFHNHFGDHCNGDGVLLYPGRQSGGWRDLHLDGVLAGLRLKQWRRGLQDAGYIALARSVDPARTEQIVAGLVGGSFEAESSPAFPTRVGPWVRARRQLFELLR